jgi:hypothetical protein
MAPLDAIARVSGTLPLRPAVTRAGRWPRMRLTKAVEEFIAELRLTKAPLTVVGYESDCHRLAAMATYNSILSFTPELVRTYFLSASQLGLSMATLHRKRAAISEFGSGGSSVATGPGTPSRICPRSSARSLCRGPSRETKWTASWHWTCPPARDWPGLCSSSRGSG